MLLVQISTILKMTMTESCSEEQNVFSFFFYPHWEERVKIYLKIIEKSLMYFSNLLDDHNRFLDHFSIETDSRLFFIFYLYAWFDEIWTKLGVHALTYTFFSSDQIMSSQKKTLFLFTLLRNGILFHFYDACFFPLKNTL